MNAPPPAGRADAAPNQLPIFAADDATARAGAIAALRSGLLVVVPTETVYGLAADARQAEAVARVFDAKGRPSHNPLIVHVSDVEAARALGHLDEDAEALAAHFWPGPLTLVVPRRHATGLASAVTAGLDTVALRVPAQPAFRALLAESGLALAAPSANPSGRLSPTLAIHAAADLAGCAAMVAAVLDGGPCALGLESTIVALGDRTRDAADAAASGTRTPSLPRLLRLGALPIEAIEQVVGPLQRPAPGGPVEAPGMMLRHYAPGRPLRINAEAPHPGEAYVAFGPNCSAGAFCNLSPRGDVGEAAAALFAALRAADAAPGYRAIAVAPIPRHGLGNAIRDRLERAVGATASGER